MTPGVTVSWLDVYNSFLTIISSGVNLLLISVMALLFIPLIVAALASMAGRR